MAIEKEELTKKDEVITPDGNSGESTVTPAQSEAKVEEQVVEKSFDEMSLEEIEAKVESDNKKSSEPPKPATPQKTIITDEVRALYNIPDKFKTLEDVAKSYSATEKEGSRIASEKDRIEKEAQELKEKLAQHEKTLTELKKETKEQVKTGEMTKEERDSIIERFELDWETDKVSTLNKLFATRDKNLLDNLPKVIEDIISKRDAEITEKRTKAEAQQKYIEERNKEEAKLKETYPNWETEIKPEVIKIAQEKPYLQTIEEALDIYEARQRALRKQTADKQIEKKVAFSESGSGAVSAGCSGNIVDEINNAKTLADLERLVSKVK